MTTISFRLSVFGANSMKLTQMGLVAHPVPGDKEPTLIIPGIGMWLKTCHNKPPSIGNGTHTTYQFMVMAGATGWFIIVLTTWLWLMKNRLGQERGANRLGAAREGAPTYLRTVLELCNFSWAKVMLCPIAALRHGNRSKDLNHDSHVWNMGEHLIKSIQ